MKLKVLFAKDVENEIGIPDLWPRKCKEVPDDYVAAPGEVVMTTEELKTYQDAMRPEYDTWEKAFKASEKKVKDDEIAEKDSQKEVLRVKLGITQEEFDLLKS